MSSIEEWKQDNPDGYQRAMDNAVTLNLYARNAERFDQGKAPMGQNEKDFHKASLPDSPDQIQKMTHDTVGKLSDDAHAYKSDMETIRNNLGLANQLENGREMFDGSAPQKADALIDRSEEIASKYGVDLEDTAAQYNIKIDTPLTDKMNGDPLNASQGLDKVSTTALSAAHKMGNNTAPQDQDKTAPTPPAQDMTI